MCRATSNLQPSPFEFAAPTRIVFGWGRGHELAERIDRSVRRVFVVSGSRTLERSSTAQVLTQLAASGREVVHLARIDHEPQVADVDAAVAELHKHRPSSADALLAIGGGAVLDLGKAVAALALSREGASVVEYLEGVGSGLQLTGEQLALLAMPTTAGTGSEVTKNAVISSTSPPFKKSLRSPKMVAALALVDPELTVSCPAHVTAQSGMDAITQLIESFVSVRATPVSRAVCIAGLQGSLDALRRAVQDGNDRAAREQMSLAALLSGLALSNSGLGLAHGVAAALGVHCGVAHGLACAVLLPMAIEVNRHVAGQRLAESAELLLQRKFAAPQDAVEALLAELNRLYEAWRIPRRLREIGVASDQLPDIVDSSYGNSMSGNPLALAPQALSEILAAHW